MLPPIRAGAMRKRLGFLEDVLLEESRDLLTSARRRPKENG
jgi:hypothetical protein